MAANTFSIQPEEFQKMPTVEVLALDPSKPYVVQIPDEVPNASIIAFCKKLSEFGIFAIVLPMKARFHCSFPIEFPLVKRQAEVRQEDIEECPGPKKQAAPSRSRTPLEVLMGSLSTVQDVIDFARKNRMDVKVLPKDGKGRVAARVAALLNKMPQDKRDKILSTV